MSLLASTWRKFAELSHNYQSLLPMTSRPNRRLWPFFLSGLLVISCLLYMSSNRSVPITIPNHQEDLASIPPPSNPLTFDNSPILLVSAFFPLPTSKHTHAEYAAWLRLFLSQISTPMVIYTTPDFAPTIRDLRSSLPIIIDTQFSSPFDVPPLKGLEDTYQKQHDELDPEKKIHNPALYATWNAKAWLLEHAAQEYATNVTEWYFWSDAGALRETHTFKDWPNLERVQDAFDKAATEGGVHLSDVFFIPIWDAPQSSRYTRLWKEDDGPLELYKMSEGSMFGGKLAAIKWWSLTFYSMHDRYLSQNKFVGKDQNIFNAILFLYPQRVFTVWPRDPQHRLETNTQPVEVGSQCTWDPWYYYFYWLAGEKERTEMLEHMKKGYSNLPLHARLLAWVGIHVGAVGRGECSVVKEWVFRDILRETVGR